MIKAKHCSLSQRIRSDAERFLPASVDGNLGNKHLNGVLLDYFIDYYLLRELGLVEDVNPFIDCSFENCDDAMELPPGVQYGLNVCGSLEFLVFPAAGDWELPFAVAAYVGVDDNWHLFVPYQGNYICDNPKGEGWAAYGSCACHGCWDGAPEDFDCIKPNDGNLFGAIVEALYPSSVELCPSDCLFLERVAGGCHSCDRRCGNHSSRLVHAIRDGDMAGKWFRCQMCSLDNNIPNGGQP